MKKTLYMSQNHALAAALSILVIGGFFAVRLFLSLHAQIIGSIGTLENDIVRAREENMLLASTLKAEQNKNNEFESQIRQIAGTVGLLDKLSKTDKELLQKYSKVYFLNEHYIPEALTEIGPDYTLNKNSVYEIHTKVWPYLEKMLKDAASQGLDLKIVSAYRSFGTQGILKSGYAVTYGTGANRFSADQGYSEHQLGTTLDFSTSQIGSAFNGFDETKEFAWLTQNAYKYGFTLSYPENNQYYVYEPWHWRFVGTGLARRLDEDNQYFYDLDQRIIDLYLIRIFD